MLGDPQDEADNGLAPPTVEIPLAGAPLVGPPHNNGGTKRPREDGVHQQHGGGGVGSPGGGLGDGQEQGEDGSTRPTKRRMMPELDEHGNDANGVGWEDGKIVRLPVCCCCV